MDNPYKTPAAELEMETMPSDIDALDVSEQWKQRFRIFDKAGPMRGGKLVGMERLDVSERRLVSYNWLAFIFSTIYYFVKGMWKKGLVFLGISWIWAALITVAEGLFSFTAPSVLYWIPISAMMAAMANWDFYRKKVHGKDMWEPIAVFDNWIACIAFVIASFALLVGSVSLFV